ncbi:MAG: hypothetical protein ACRYFZ_01765 [Janthinobacterium lividum]
MYHDGPDLEAYHHGAGRDTLPVPSRWHRRALGLALLGLLVVMHSCG